MAITRRQILAGLGAAALARAQQKPQQPLAEAPGQPPTLPDGPRVPRPRTPPKPRSSPAVCLYSQHLIKIEYEAVGMVLRDLGYDGADLAVVPGSHVAPEQASSDLMRSIEAVSGVGLEVPIISTSVVSANDPYGRQILGIAGFMGIGLFRPGYWKFSGGPEREMRLAQVQRDLLQLASIARAYNVATAFHNSTGDAVGANLADVNGFLRNVDPRWVGYDYDPGNSAEMAGPETPDTSLAAALPRIKAVTVRDFTWKDGKAVPCALGQGVVDWKAFFTTLARAKFNGPLTVQVAYSSANELNAFRHDLEFVRKQIAAAYTS
ncbi:MAG: Xylose isomerase domain protein barrel [Candidatus Solibacter sp.]|jgi:L-ribulose-5-phosphate 3-epimerase|nr:Xylose isomerase domain protein barrel [Candidatus Solibacter sp.]